MKLKMCKMLLFFCVMLLFIVSTIDTSLANSIAVIGGGYMEDAIHIVPFMG